MKSTLHNFLRKGSLLKTSLIFGLILSAGFIHSQTKVIPVLKPTQGFGLDGKVQVESINSGDWINDPTVLNTSLAESIFSFDPVTKNIINSSPESSVWYRDKWNDGLDEMFGSGAKFVDDPNTLVVTSGKSPSKNDIHNAFYHVSIDNVGNPYLFIAGDRYSTTGTSYIDFEFLQGELGYNAARTGFSYKDNNNRSGTGGRTPGDIVISMEYSGGGSTAIAYVYKWGNTTGIYTYDLVGQFNLSNFSTYQSAAVTNAVTVPMAGGAFGKTSYAPYAFVEAAVNLSTEIFKSGTGGCDAVTFKTIFIKTKASNSSTAALKDFIPPQTINLKLGGIGLSYPAYNCNDLISPLMSGTVATGGKFTTSNNNLIIDANSGIINYTASKSGTYTITFTKTINTNCVATATTTVVVSNNPPVLNCPGDKVVECGSAANYATSATGTPTASVACGNAVVTYVDGSMTNSGCTSYFLRTWSAYDDKTKMTSTCVQKILIRDKTAPTASSIIVNLTCGATLPAPPTATDNCVGPIQTILVSVTESIGSSTVCKDLVRTYQYMDQSGNISSNVTQTIKFTDPAPVTPTNLTTETTLAQSSPLTVKAYPNPFSSEVNFDLKSNISGPVKLVLYDVSGRSLGIVYQGMVNAGDQRKINIDGQKYGASTIIYRLMVGDQMVTGKLLKPVQQP